MTNRDDQWKELAARLSSLLQSFSSSLDDGSIELIRDFIKNREFGVAIEWLHSTILENQISITDDQAQQFGRLAGLMNIKL